MKGGISLQEKRFSTHVQPQLMNRVAEGAVKGLFGLYAAQLQSLAIGKQEKEFEVGQLCFEPNCQNYPLN